MSPKNTSTTNTETAGHALVPKLRFPEFRDAEGWKHIPLNRLALRTKQKNRDEKIDRVLTNSAEFGVVDQRDFFDKDIATQGKLDGYFVVDLGSYVYNPRISSIAPVGPISKNKIGTGVMSPLYTVFKFNDERNDFYEHFFKTTCWHAYMRQASSTGARHDRMAISNDDFMAMPLPVSTLPEQQKIADCLSSVDELIAAQAQKLDALKTHKKGLMQQLFPREGETQPRLRFPEFQNSGEWEVKTIGELKPFVTSGSRGWAEFYADQGELFVRITNLWRDSIYLDLTDSKFVQLPPGAKEGVRTQLKEHDVLISITADIGIIGYVDGSVPSPAYINQHIALVRFDTPKLYGKYVAYFLASERSQRFFRSTTDTGTKAGTGPTHLFCIAQPKSCQRRSPQEKTVCSHVLMRMYCKLCRFPVYSRLLGERWKRRPWRTTFPKLMTHGAKVSRTGMTSWRCW